MASSYRNCSKGLFLRLVVAILIFCLTFLPLKTVGLMFSSNGEALEQKKMVLGSRPPLCINKCFNCRPCRATLVIPPHKTRFQKEDDTYYLLTWKCRCGNKIYQP
ncbi:hypothetical protein FRX31_019557 [Thalictrum thalictroides]|uniref:Epidermal patterning factor-like protein n=1 Tax=Thalictrum thalictroides TaxID=46969 RepID=A0A7J6W2T2_THATH|nr:hypothetical protein FRX31_019557 [Thalictrum thalictroides]